MGRPHGPFPATRVLAGFLGAIVAIVAIEATLARHERNYRDVVEQSWRRTGQDAERLDPRTTLLCLGDSMVKHGALPTILEERLGGKAYNLALPGGPPPATHLVLRRVFATGARPRALLIDIEQAYHFQGLWEHATIWPQVLRPWDALRLAWQARDPEFLASMWLRAALPSFRNRHHVRDRVPRVARGDPVPRLGRLLDVFERHWTMNQGADILPENEDGLLGADDALAWLTKPRSRPSPAMVRAIDALLTEAEAHQARTFLLLPPLRPDLQALREAAGLEAAHDRFIATLQARHRELVVLDARRSGYAVEQFAHDGAHLAGAGAAILSHDIARSVAAALAGDAVDRWLELPPQGPRRITARVEGREESQRRFNQERATRRR